MLKLTIAVLAAAVASTAGAEGWRSMKLEASDLTSFTKSLAAFEAELSTPRSYVFKSALQDLWTRGTQRASSEQREYTEVEYFRQLDGLGYDEILTLADPTGETTKARYRDAVMQMRATRDSQSSVPPQRTRAGVSGQPAPMAMGSSAPTVAGPGGQYRGGRGW